jgi:TolA-binding protein
MGASSSGKLDEANASVQQYLDRLAALEGKVEALEGQVEQLKLENADIKSQLGKIFRFSSMESS